MSTGAINAIWLGVCLLAFAGLITFLCHTIRGR